MELLKVYTLFLIFQFNVFLATSQKVKFSSYTYNLKYHRGFVMYHSVNMGHLANQRPKGIELDIFKVTTGKKLWQQIHKYPIIGYSFQYLQMDSNKPLGNSYSLIIYYGKRIAYSKKSIFYYRLGWGLAYIEKRFDATNNYKNNLISSRFNYALNGRLNYSFQLNDHCSINTGIGIIHFSNGATKVPNLGVNIPTVHFGISFTPKADKQFLKDSLPALKKEVNLIFSMAGGFKQVYPVNGPTYFASSFSSYINKRISRKSSLNIGADILFDGSNNAVLKANNLEQNNKFFKIGTIVGHEFHIHDISLLTQLGFYIYDPLKLEKWHYQRIALKYYFSEKVFATIGLKTHLGSADYTEWGLGIKL
jgi:hypothetical protein